MGKIFKWGIIGPGKIAQKFAAALSLVPDAVLHAVASRDAEKAKQFAATWGAPVYYNNYEALAADASLDAVYIATPHTFHHAHVLLCLRNKKAVLCEKPMSVDYASTLEMVNTARQNGVFLMEAMWTRFLPAIEKTLALIQEGVIGKLKYLQADFGFSAPYNAGSRLYDLRLGGGAQLDIGVYPLFLALLLMGKPDAVKSFSRLAPGGADESTSAILYYNDGKIANIHSSIVAQTPISAAIAGTEGALILHRPWYKGSHVQVRKNDTITAEFALPFGDNGFEFQVQEVHRCLLQGMQESTVLPLDFSLLLSSVSHEICAQAGLSYEIQPA